MTAPDLAVSRPAGRAIARKLLAGAVLLAGLNGLLYATAPALFEVDLARAPYTEANNLELTRVYHRALPLYRSVADRFPGSRYAVLAEIGIANSLVGLGRQGEALDAYEAVRRRIESDPAHGEHLYAVLERLAALYRDTGDADRFRDIHGELGRGFPGSRAFRDADAYLATLSAAAGPGGSAAAGVAIDPASVTVPGRLAVGETGTVALTLVFGDGAPASVSLATNLEAWRGLRAVQVSPSPAMTSEYWGRRMWQFPAGTGGRLEVRVLVEAVAPGRHLLDLDLEVDFDVVETGIARTIDVGE